MNFVQKILTQHVEKLEADSKKLERVRTWYDRVANLSTAPHVPWDEFKELEAILEHK